MLSFTLALCHDIIPILWLTWVLTSDGRLPYVYGLSVPLFTVAGIDNPPNSFDLPDNKDPSIFALSRNVRTIN